MGRIRQARRRLGLSQEELGEAAGVSAATIVQVELGHRQPQGRTLRKLAAALGVEVADLLEEEGSPKVEGRSSLEPTLFKDVEGERHEDIYEVVTTAVRRQAKQDRQAAARTFESERPQTYFKHHENELVQRLLQYSADELVGALIEIGRRCIQLEEGQAKQRLDEPQEYADLLKERGFSSEQIAAYLEQSERDEEFIRQERKEMSDKDKLEELMASLGAKLVRNYYKENPPQASATSRSESA